VTFSEIERLSSWANGQEKFALGIEDPDIFLFKVDLDMVLLQLADSGKAVYRIPGEAAHRLGDDEVDATGEGIGNHLFETVPMAGIGRRNALVRRPTQIPTPGCSGCSEFNNQFAPRNL